MSKQNCPIAVFDSGIGGLSVLRHLRAQLPHEHIIYLADQAHVPYGTHSRAEIYQFSQAITQFFLTQSAKLLVVACNTASAAALTCLRHQFPQLPIVGMEPAVKPAATRTKRGKVGVLATNVTFDSSRYTSLMTRFAQDITVFEDPCIGLVDQIEAGHIDTPQTRQLLQSILAPMLAAHIDVLVLGCTHYPFVAPLIQQIIGPDVTIIDPAPAVARQTCRILQQHHLCTTHSQPGQTHLFTTGNQENFARIAAQLLPHSFETSQVIWHENTLYPT